MARFFSVSLRGEGWKSVYFCWVFELRVGGWWVHYANGLSVIEVELIRLMITVDPSV